MKATRCQNTRRTAVNPVTHLARNTHKAVLFGTIAPAMLVTQLMAVDVPVPPDFTIDSDTGSPLYFEGLEEGFLNASDNETTPNPKNSTPELGLRMATRTDFGADAWANPRTWIYTGQIFTGPLGVISIAANNDDTDWFRINGTVVLNDNGWNTTVATVVTGLTPNTWVDFEYRVSDTGAGGAGPSGQNNGGASNWTSTRGAVISHDDEGGSLNALDYTYGLSGVGSYEPAGGGPTLFRYQSGFGFADDIKVDGTGTVTINGANPTVAEPSLQFRTTGATLTVNDGTGSHKTIQFTSGTTLGNANGQSNTINGTSDVRLGALLDGGFTGLTLTHAGPGRLILDSAGGNSAAGATISAGVGGNIFLRGSGANPTATLGALSISGSGGMLTIDGPDTTIYDTQLNVAEDGTLAHTSAVENTVGGVSGISISAGRTLALNNTGGLLTVAGAVSGATLSKGGGSEVNITGVVNLDTLVNNAGILRLSNSATVVNLTGNGGILRANGNVAATNVNVIAGRVEINGVATIVNNPAILSGATLALRNGAGTNSIPDPVFVPSGNLEIIPGALGGPGVQANLVGGTLTLDAPSGLVGRYYNGDDGGANSNFGSFATYSTYFATRDGGGGGGVAAVTNLTTTGGVTALSYNPSGSNSAMYSAYGFLSTNNIVSRQLGSILITQPGNYTFGTTSDDGSMLFINGTTVVSNNFYQGMTRRTGTFTFPTAGLYSIDIGFYEGGGGNGMVVDWAGPATGGATQTLPNSVLFPDPTPASFANPVNVAVNSTIHVAYHSAVLNSLTVQTGTTLAKTGNDLFAAPVLPGAGSYGFDVTGNFIATNVQDGGADVDINKTGAGVLILDNTTTPQLQNTGSTVTVTQGAVGLLLETGGLNPLGNAGIVFNGGGVVLSSKGGDQSFAIPAFSGDGSVEARRIGSGVAGPVNMNLTGSLAIAGGQTITLGTADAYVMNVGGTSSGTGTLKINGGQVNVTSPGGINGFKLVMNPPVSANLDVDTSSLSLQSIATENAGASSITAGVGGPATLTLNGSDTALFSGALNEAGGSTLALVRDGTGKQIFAGNNNFTGGVTVNSGTLEFRGVEALDANAITLNGGTLQLLDKGLRLRVYDADPNATGAYSGILNTLSGVNSHYAGLGVPVTDTLTSADGNLVISYNPDGDGDAPFAIHGNTQLDNIQAIFTGKFYAAAAGDYTFDPRSDDGTMVYVNGTLVSNNNFPQGIGHVPRPGTINLSQGIHEITMTFNEGGGGAGMYVNVTRPGAGTSLLSNTELLTDFTASNTVHLNASATIDPQGTVTTLGTLNHAVGATLSTGAGTVAFGTSNLAAGVHGFNVGASGTMIPGAIVDGGAPISINKSGPGTLLLNSTALQLQNAASAIAVNDGTLAVVTGVLAAPLGNASVALGANTTLTLGSSGGNVTVTPSALSLTGSANIIAGNFGGGSVNGPLTTTLDSNLSIPGASTLTAGATSSYTLAFDGTISGPGAMSVSQGAVRANGPVILGGALNINGGSLTALSGISANSISVNPGTTLNSFSTVSSAAGLFIGQGASFQGNGATYTGGAVTLDGGTIHAQTGITDFSSSTLSGTAYSPGTTANALRGRFLGTGGEFVPSLYPGNTEAGILAAITLPAVEATLTNALSFGPQGSGDAPFSTFFGGVNTGQRFTAAFVGSLTVPLTGNYQGQAAIVDDFAGIWVDLNQNGVFEQAGSAGSELISSQGCCGDGPIGSANLVGGQTYRVAFAVEDTGGGSSLEARFGAGGPLFVINPGDTAQTGLWSFNTPSGGGSIRVDGGATLNAGGISNIQDIHLAGNGAQFTLGGSGTNTTAVLHNTGVGAGQSAVIDVGTGRTLVANILTVANGSTLVKTGAGTLNSSQQSLGTGSTIEVQAGVLNLNGLNSQLASNGAGNTGGVVVNGGRANINGSIIGSAVVNAGGTLGGTGSLGAVSVNSGGIIAPGASPGTLTTGDLAIGGTFEAEILSALSYDILVTNGTVDLTGATLSLSLLNPSLLVAGDKLFIIQNDSIDPVTGTFSGLPDDATFTIGPAEFQITYDADVGTLDLDNGNDVALLVVVPEPGALAMLLGGLGMLAAARRPRRTS